MASFHRFALGMLIVLGAGLAGCAGQSVQHLPQSKWTSPAPQRLPMRYFSFQYQIVPLGEEIGVVAKAYPVAGRLPSWATRYGEITLDIYITDEDGRILANRSRSLLPRPLDSSTGLPLEARFNLGTAAKQPLNVAFGYRVSLTDDKPDSVNRRVIVAEGALE